jgi:hypothetical protein
VGSLLTFDIPQTALVATLDTYDFIKLKLKYKKYLVLTKHFLKRDMTNYKWEFKVIAARSVDFIQPPL